MSVDIRPVPDLRRIVMAWARETYEEQLGTRPDGTLLVRDEAPVNLRELLEEHGFFLRVGQLPGRSDRHEVTAPIDLDFFALTDLDAGDLARSADAKLMRGWIALPSGASLQIVTNRMSPATVPWADAAVRRYMSSYTVTARR